MKNALEIVPVSRMDEVLTHALVRQPTAITWEEVVKPVKAGVVTGEDEGPGLVAH